jgi:hypothetical protein
MGQRSRFIALVLYLATGFSTGYLTLFALGWSALGRTPLPYEVIAFFAAFVLLAAAGVVLVRPRAAAFLALAACLAIWPFVIAYVATPFVTDRVAPADKEFEVIFVRWLPGSEPLRVENRQYRSVVTLSDDELERLAAEGVNTGTLMVTERLRGHRRATGRVLVVVSQQLDTQEVKLPQPKEGTLIYLQRGSEWLKIPSDVPTSGLNVRLEIANHTNRHTWYYVEGETGASGGTAFIWDE